jgi:hypothetical protein
MCETTQIGCRCGQTHLEVEGKPIESVECCCTSCREAAERMQQLDDAPQILTDHATTPFVMYRKDRVRFLSGSDNLAGFRLSAKAHSTRVIATCCNTPVHLEFKGGHWLSLYGALWPDGTVPAPTMRTMAADLPEGTTLPDDILNAKKHNIGFFAKLFGAWVAMGFRNPKMPKTREFNV